MAAVVLAMLAFPALAQAQGPVSTPGNVGVSAALVVNGQEVVERGQGRVEVEDDGRFAVASMSEPPILGWQYHAQFVDRGAIIGAGGGWAVIDDTVTLSAPATVTLMAVSSGPRPKRLDVGLGAGCAGAGASTASGFHRLTGGGEYEFAAIEVALPAGTSPLNAVIETTSSFSSTVQFALRVPPGVTVTSGSGQLPVYTQALPPNTVADAEDPTDISDACTPYVATTEFENVTAAGNTTLTSTATGPAPPAGYTAQRYLTFASSATFGAATPCFSRDRVKFSSLARIFQRQADAWVDVTTDAAADDFLCARVTGFGGPLLVAAPARPQEVGNYPDFASTHGLTINSPRRVELAGRLRLTDAEWQAASVFTTEPIIDPAASFHSRFTFALTEGTRADGIAFVVQRDPRGATGLGEPGGPLGYGGLTPSVAVEFDIHDNTPDGYSEAGSNHVAIALNGDVAHPVASAVPAFDLYGPGPVHAWVDYDATTKRLLVFVAQSDVKPALPLLTAPVELDGRAHAGFTASTGDDWAIQELHSFKLDREAPPQPPVDEEEEEEEEQPPPIFDTPPIQQQPQSGPISEACQTRTVTIGTSIVKGCLTGSGKVLRGNSKLVVDGLTLEVDSGDHFMVDTEDKTIETTKPGSEVTASAQGPQCERVSMVTGLARFTGNVVYRGDASVKGIAGMSARLKERIEREGLVGMLAGSFERAPSGVGAVIARGTAQLGNFRFMPLGAVVRLAFANPCLTELAANLKAAAGRAFDFEVEDVEVFPTRYGFRAKGKLSWADFAKLDLELQIERGFWSGRLTAANLPFLYPPGMRLSKAELAMNVAGSRATWSGEFDIGFSLPKAGTSFLKGQARLEQVDVGGGRIESRLAGIIAAGQFGNLPPVAGGSFEITPTDFRVSSTFRFGGLGAGQFDGKLDGWIARDRLAVRAFNLEGSGALSATNATAQAVLSSEGMAACSRLTGTVPLTNIAYSLDAGIGKRWTDPLPKVFVDGCDLGPYRATASAAQLQRTFSVAKDTRVAMLAVAGTAPVLTGPDGKPVTPARTFGVGETTYLVLAGPAAGTWTVAGATDAKLATALPEPKVTARVTRRGLVYTVAPIPGQRVTFVEAGDHVHRVLGVARGRRGTLRFTPADAPGRPRRILAMVTQDGRPRTTLNVARFTAPGLRPVARVARITVKRTRATATLSWRRIAGARRYEVTVRLRGRAEHVLSTRRPKLRLTGLDRRSRGTVSVRVVGTDGALGAARIGRVALASGG